MGKGKAMGLRIRTELKDGYNEIVRAEDPRLEFVEFGILKLKDGASYRREPEFKETGLVVLCGRCTIAAGDQVFEAIGDREDVFAGAPYAVYVPCDTPYSVMGIGEADVAVCTAPSDLRSAVRLITPGEVKVHSVGTLNWRRDVRDIIDVSVEAKHLVIGETVNPPGHWSSAPPHRHDFDNLPEEVDMEEVYFFRVNPRQGFGLQRVYTDDRSVDEAYTVENDDTVVLPEGYHPVVAGPGYRLYYLWILAGRQRVLRPRDDPHHRWLKDAEPIMEEVGL